MQYKRILLKLSGESLAGNNDKGINNDKLMEYCRQLREIAEKGIQVGVVIGGGNIFRGLKGTDFGFDRVKGDQMGMLATVINGLAIQSALHGLNVPCELYTSIRMEPVGKLYSRDEVIESMNNGKITILSGGTGNPFFTTDTAAALRAVELKTDVLLKGTRVDGVYDSDPEKNPDARRFTHITFDEVYQRQLSVMDLTAFTMCKENNMPVYVFDMDTPGNLLKVVEGENIGTLVS